MKDTKLLLLEVLAVVLDGQKVVITRSLQKGVTEHWQPLPAGKVFNTLAKSRVFNPNSCSTSKRIRLAPNPISCRSEIPLYAYDNCAAISEVTIQISHNLSAQSASALPRWSASFPMVERAFPIWGKTDA